MKKLQIVGGGGIATPNGFLASGMHVGIKKKKSKYDASLIYSQLPAKAAAVFTTNKVKAWPVLHAMKAIRHPLHQVILASSGNANCINGVGGKKAVSDVVREVAKELSIAEGKVLVAQTGVIGAPFPTEALKKGIPILHKRLSRRGSTDAAKGILTTDLVTKETAVKIKIGNKTVKVGAVAKGSGMIHPNMATMLCFVSTDAAISKSLLQQALKESVRRTFNRISVDNDMSTNDCVYVLANGAAGNKSIAKKGRDYDLFQAALEEVCRKMAYAMVEDGEGVAHVCTLNVEGAKTELAAEKVARHIANSMLFKTMLTGSDPNWGRIIAAVGSSGGSFNEEKLDLAFEKVKVISKGKLKIKNIPAARKVLKKKSYQITVGLGVGQKEVQFVTSDLTKRYVEINAEYC